MRRFIKVCRPTSGDGRLNHRDGDAAGSFITVCRSTYASLDEFAAGCAGSSRYAGQPPATDAATPGSRFPGEPFCGHGRISRSVEFVERPTARG
jgi:hypothetical protein